MSKISDEAIEEMAKIKYKDASSESKFVFACGTYIAGAKAMRDLMKRREDKLVDALEFYATHHPTQFPEGYYEIHNDLENREGGHIRFGTKARQALKEHREETDAKD